MPADAELLGNLGGGELPAGGQAHRQQPLVSTHIALALGQRGRHGTPNPVALELV